MNAKTLKKVAGVLNSANVELTPGRVQKLANLHDRLGRDFDTVKIETCIHGGGDVYRYGKSKIRAGKAELVGMYRYNNAQRQIWAVWQ